MTEDEVIQKLFDFLKSYPDYDIENYKVLFDFNETQKIANCILDGNIDELSVEDFEKIGNGCFLLNCGSNILNQRDISRNREFLLLSRNLSNKSKKFFERGTLNYALTVLNEGTALREISNYGNKKNNLENAINLFLEAKNHGLEENSYIYGVTLNKLACSYKNLAELGVSPINNLNEALRLLEQAKKIPAVRSSPLYHWISGNEANVKRELVVYGKNPVELINLLKKTRENFEENSEDYARSLLNEGIATRTLALYSCPDCKKRLLNDSITLYQRSRKEGFKLDSENYASALTEEGVSNFYLSFTSSDPKSYLDKTIEFHEKALEKGGFLNPNRLFHKIKLNNISAKLQLSIIEKNTKLLNIVIKDSEEQNLFFKKDDDKKNLMDLYNNIGTALYHHERMKEAYNYFKKSIKLSEQLRKLINIQNRKSFFETVVYTYKMMVSTCVALNKDKEAFKYAECAKSRTFLEFLWYKNNSNASSEDTQKFEPGNLNKISKFVKNKTLVEYFLGDGLITFILKNGELIIKNDKTNLTLVIESIIEFRNIIEEINKETQRYNYESLLIEDDDKRKHKLKEYYKFREIKCNNLNDLLEKLYIILIKPIESYLDEEIILIPHGPLHLLPLQALYNDKYLIEDYKISLAQSASSLEFLKPGTGTGSLVVGNPDKGTENSLQFAEEEAIKIAKKLHTKPLIGDKATRDRVLQLISDKEIIHFSCHGIFDPFCPIYSRIKLTDDFLKASDFMDIELHANLMVLSSCETAIGEIIGGDEVEGLVRSIQFSGCRFVIASLWSVESESTKDLFLKFYNTNGDVLKKLQNAQINLISKDCDVYSWAPFQLYGI